MECPKCQPENPAEANFCLKCGVPLGRSCPKYGKEIPSEGAFCMACGHDPSKRVTPSESMSQPEAVRSPASEGEHLTPYRVIGETRLKSRFDVRVQESAVAPAKVDIGQ